MRAKAWNNGAHHPSGAGYGLRVLVEDRDRYFSRDWTEIMVDIPEQTATTIALSDSFWRACTELRSAALGLWLRESGRAPWPRGEPPSIGLVHVRGNRFSIDGNAP